MSEGQYPLIDEAFPNLEHQRLLALGHTENRRSAIAHSAGIEMLAIADQYARAMYELDISTPDNAEVARTQIEAALAMFSIRGFAAGEGPKPKDIMKAIRRIARSASNIQADLNLLMWARRDIGIGNQIRAESLEQIQRVILGSIVADVMPLSISRKITCDEIEAAMPTVNNSQNSHSYSNEFQRGFTTLSEKTTKLANNFDLSELSKPTRNYDIHLARFIGHLGNTFNNWTGRDSHSPDRNANQPRDWRGPFSRFVEAVWPLTPEGSGGSGPTRRCPTNKKIRLALKQSALLPTNTAL